MRKSTFRLLQPFIILHIIIMVGIFGYMIIEHASFVDSLFMTTISITTVGYGEVVPLSVPGKWFTIFLLITSWGTFAFAITRITQFVVSGEINQYFKTRKLMKNIAKMPIPTNMTAVKTESCCLFFQMGCQSRKNP